MFIMSFASNPQTHHNEINQIIGKKNKLYLALEDSE